MTTWILGGQSGLESMPSHSALCRVVLETVLRVRGVLKIPFAPLNQKQLVLFSRKKSVNNWCHHAGPPWAQEGLNYSSTD